MWGIPRDPIELMQTIGFKAIPIDTNKGSTKGMQRKYEGKTKELPRGYKGKMKEIQRKYAGHTKAI